MEVEVEIEGATVERACSACAALVPADAARHCCLAKGCCGTRWCDACLDAAEAVAEAAAEAVAEAAAEVEAAEEEPPSSVAAAGGQARGDGIISEFVADLTMPDGARLAPGGAVRKVWRLRLYWEGGAGDGGGGCGDGGACRGGGAPCQVTDPRRWPRLVRGYYAQPCNPLS